MTYHFDDCEYEKHIEIEGTLKFNMLGGLVVTDMKVWVHYGLGVFHKNITPLLTKEEREHFEEFFEAWALDKIIMDQESA